MNRGAALPALALCAAIFAALPGCGGLVTKEEAAPADGAETVCEALTGLAADTAVAEVDGLTLTAGDLCPCLVASVEEYLATAGLDAPDWTAEMDVGVTLADYLKGDALCTAALYGAAEVRAKARGLAPAGGEAEPQAALDALAVSLSPGADTGGDWLETAGRPAAVKALARRGFDGESYARFLTRGGYAAALKVADGDEGAEDFEPSVWLADGTLTTTAAYDELSLPDFWAALSDLRAEDGAG